MPHHLHLGVLIAPISAQVLRRWYVFAQGDKGVLIGVQHIAVTVEHQHRWREHTVHDSTDDAGQKYHTLDIQVCKWESTRDEGPVEAYLLQP